MFVKSNSNKIEISFSYNAVLVSFVKSLDGRRYNPATKSWFIPLTGSHESLKRLASRGFDISPNVWAESRKDAEQAREAEALAIMPGTEFTTPLPLFPYQKVGAAFLWKIGSGLLGDQPGLGKTLMAIAVVEKAKATKVLVFCPAVLKEQWAKEIKRFLPGTEVVVIEGIASERAFRWRHEARFYI